jgi:single-stranded DNA-binding protein
MHGMTGVFFGKCRQGATLKTSKKGHAFVQVPLLVANGKDALGYPDQTIVRLVAFDDLAAALSKTLRRNDHVRAEGSVKLETWNDKEGFQRTCLALIAAKVEKLNAETETNPGIFGARQGTPRGRKNLAALMLAAAR